MRPREPEATHVVLPSSPRILFVKTVAAWPLAGPASGERVASSWSALRPLLPDSNGAPSGARREHLWQRCTRGGGHSEDGAAAVEVQALQHHIETLAMRHGVIDRLSTAPPSPEKRERRELFLSDAVRGACELVGTFHKRKREYIGNTPSGVRLVEMLPRAKLRVFLLRLHQFLDVIKLLNDDPETAVDDPRSGVGFRGFVCLLQKRPHLVPPEVRALARSDQVARGSIIDVEGPTSPSPRILVVNAEPGVFKPDSQPLAVRQLFAQLCATGKSSIFFNTLARWSLKLQLVRPGSGALVPQKRWPTHWASPASVGTYGAHYTARGRSDLQEAPTHRAAPTLQRNAGEPPLVRAHRAAPPAPHAHRAPPPAPLHRQGASKYVLVGGGR